MYSMETIVNNTVLLYSKVAERVDLKILKVLVTRKKDL